MMTNPTAYKTHLPFKSLAGALLFSVALGPVGLLYASFWGGLILIPIAIVILSCKFYFIALLLWVISCIWSVGAVESYNRKIARAAAFV